MSETRGQHEFSPDWCLAPDGPLREWMAGNGIRLPALALACAGTGDQAEPMSLIQEVLDRKPLGPAHADLLERGTGIPAGFWQRYEATYRAGLAAGLTDVSEPLEVQ